MGAGEAAVHHGAGRASGGLLRLRRIADDGGPLLLRILQDPELRRTGFAESDAEPHELLTADARVWSVESGGEEVGLVWLDRCPEHPGFRECGLFMLRRSRGFGPRVLIAALMYACVRLSAGGVCFEAKEYNRQVIAMCERAGIRSHDRRPHVDDFHPSGSSELVGFVIERGEMGRNPDWCRALLRTPIEILDRAGEVEFTASVDTVPR